MINAIINLKHILDELPLELILVEPDTHSILLANQPFLKRHRLTPDEVYGKKCYAVTHNRSTPCEEPDEPCPLRESVLHRCKATEIHTHYSKDGTQYQAEVTTCPIYDDNNNIIAILHTVRDITKLQKQLLHLEQQAALGIMASCIGHEINNQLTGLLGYIELFKLSTNRSFDAEALKDMESLCNNLQELAKDLLRQGKPRHKPFTQIDIVFLIKEAVQSFIRQGILKHITIKYKLPDHPIYVDGEESYLLQVIRNLCTNAADAMQECKHKLLTIKIEYLTEDSVCLCIEDTGCGIPEDKLATIFNLFYTTKDESHGTGLGLPIVKSIIKHHNGHIDIESKVGKGTKVKIILPLSKSQEPIGYSPNVSGPPTC